MKSLLGAMVLLAAGCGSGMLGESPLVNGQIADWRMGGGYKVTAELYGPPGLQTVSVGTVDESGAFSLELPSSEKVAPHLLGFTTLGLPASCLTSLADSELGGMQEAMLKLSVKKDEGPAVQIDLANTEANSNLVAGRIGGRYIYVDRDGSFTRRLECGSSITIDVDAKLRRGWNILIDTITEVSTVPDGTHVSATLHVGALPADVKWQMSKAPDPS